MRSRNISRRVLRFLLSYSKSANVGWSIVSFTPNIFLLHTAWYYAIIRQTCSEYP